MRKRWACLAIVLVLSACDDAPLDVSLMDQRDEMVRFRVDNKSPQAVRSATFVVRYEVEGESAPRADTVRYTVTPSASGEIPFVGGGEGTFFPHQLPAGASRPSAEVVDVEFWDGSAWPAN